MIWTITNIYAYKKGTKSLGFICKLPRKQQTKTHSSESSKSAMSALSIQQQMEERRNRLSRNKQKHNYGDDFDEQDVKIDINHNRNNHNHNHNHNHNNNMMPDIDEYSDIDSDSNEVSFQPQIHEIQKEIKLKEDVINKLYTKLQRETEKLSKLQYELKQLQSRQNNHNHNHNHNNNHNNNRNILSTPQLIREERRRMIKQEENDHEIALQLQRQIDREQRQEQEQEREEEESDAHSDDINVNEEGNMNNQSVNLPQRDPFQILNSSAFSSPFRGRYASPSFDQSGFRAIQRWQSRIQRQHFNNNRNRYGNPHNLYRRFLIGQDIDNMSFEELNNLFPNIPQGANEETIQRLPTELVNDNHNHNNHNHNNNDNNKCCICLEKFKNGEEIRRLPCLHIFHQNEIDQWLRQNRLCPICRISVEQS